MQLINCAGSGLLNRRGRLLPRARWPEDERRDANSSWCRRKRPGRAVTSPSASMTSAKSCWPRQRSARGSTHYSREAGASVEELDRVVIAGAFGTHIDVESAVGIGMLPELPLSRIEQVGNAAGVGARLALISAPLRERAVAIARQIHVPGTDGAARFRIPLRAGHVLAGELEWASVSVRKTGRSSGPSRQPRSSAWCCRVPALADGVHALEWAGVEGAAGADG